MTNFRVLKNLVIAKNLLPKLKSNILISSNVKITSNWKQVPGFIFKPNLLPLNLPGRKYLVLNTNALLSTFYKLKILNCYFDKKRFLFVKNYLNWKMNLFVLFQFKIFFWLILNGKKSRSF